MKWAKAQGCKSYDMSGVVKKNDLDKHQKRKYVRNMYLFKRGFGGRYEELVGEYDLIYRPVMYGIVNIGYRLKKILKCRINGIFD